MRMANFIVTPPSPRHHPWHFRKEAFHRRCAITVITIDHFTFGDKLIESFLGDSPASTFGRRHYSTGWQCDFVHLIGAVARSGKISGFPSPARIVIRVRELLGLRFTER